MPEEGPGAPVWQARSQRHPYPGHQAGLNSWAGNQVAQGPALLLDCQPGRLRGAGWENGRYAGITLAGILPDATELEALETATVASCTGGGIDTGRWRHRPYRLTDITEIKT